MLRENSKGCIPGRRLEMCVHHWILDSFNQGVCKKCGREKDFSEPPIKLTKLEKSSFRAIFNHDFSVRGKLPSNFQGIKLDEDEDG